MKKLISIMTLLLLVCFAQAQDNSFFQSKPSGVTVSGEIPTSLDKAAVLEKIKNWALGVSVGSQAVQDPTSGAITVSGALQTKSSYNPFAGTFTETLGFMFIINIDPGVVKYEVTNFTLMKFYAGYGTNNKTMALSDIIDQLAAAKETIKTAESSTTMSKKERKKAIEDAEDTIEDNTESLKKAQGELEKLIDGLKAKLK